MRKRHAELRCHLFRAPLVQVVPSKQPNFKSSAIRQHDTDLSKTPSGVRLRLEAPLGGRRDDALVEVGRRLHVALPDEPATRALLRPLAVRVLEANVAFARSSEPMQKMLNELFGLERVASLEMYTDQLNRVRRDQTYAEWREVSIKLSDALEKRRSECHQSVSHFPALLAQAESVALLVLPLRLLLLSLLVELVLLVEPNTAKVVAGAGGGAGIGSVGGAWWRWRRWCRCRLWLWLLALLLLPRLLRWWS